MLRKNKLKHLSKNRKHQLRLVSIYLLGILFFTLLIFFTHRLIGSDDYAFQTQIKPFDTLSDWTTYRYNSWSGRIFAESFVYIFSPLPIIFWKIVSVLLYALFSGFIFLYYALFTKKRTPLKDYLMLIAALALPLLMDTHVLTEGMLWVTGSMNYFWLVTFGFIGFYPVAFYLSKQYTPQWFISMIGVISAIIAASSHEQIGAVLCTLSVIFTIYVFWIKKKIPFYLIGFTVLFIISFAFGITAPGNHLRISVETISKLPDFYTIPLLEHIEYAYRWLIDSLINRFGLLFAASWILLLALFVSKKRAYRLDKIDYAVIAVLGVACLFLCLKGFNGIDYWFNFFATWKVHAPRASFALLPLWTIVLLTTLIAPIVLYRKQIIGPLVSILFCAVIASTVLITLSPTMYASGSRVLYVPSIILMFIIYILLGRVYDQYKKFSYLFIIAISCIATSHFLLLLREAHK